MLGLSSEPEQEATTIEVELPEWLHGVDLLIVDFDCLVGRSPIREIAMRDDLRDFFQFAGEKMPVAANAARVYG